MVSLNRSQLGGEFFKFLDLRIRWVGLLLPAVAARHLPMPLLPGCHLLGRPAV
jgi:hypothetical protein